MDQGQDKIKIVVSDYSLVVPANPVIGQLTRQSIFIN